MEGLRGIAVPNGPGPPGGGTGSPAQAAVRAYGGPAVEGKPETAQAHQLGGQGVLPRRRSSPMEGLQGMTVHNGPGAPSGGTGSPAQVAVGAWLRGTLAPIGAGPPARRTGSPAHPGGRCLWRTAGDCSSQRPGPTSSRGRGSGLGGGRCLWRERGRRQVPNGPGPLARGTGSPAQAAVGAYGGHAGDGSSQQPGPTSSGDEESCPGGGR